MRQSSDFGNIWDTIQDYMKSDAQKEADKIEASIQAQSLQSQKLLTYSLVGVAALIGFYFYKKATK